MKQLLAPGGCPWDREQTLESLRPYLLEEAYEVLEAVEEGGAGEHCEELGDLLMQIVFHAELREKEDAFAIDDVIRAAVDKLVRRHPHVFGDIELADADAVLAQWTRLKEEERRAKAPDTAPRRTLDGVPRALPALARAQKLSQRAAQVGFDWPDAEGARVKVSEELAELDQARSRGDRVAVEEEVGDALLAMVNLARKLDCDAEAALRAALARFSRRFAFVEDRLAEAERGPGDATSAELEALWEQAKSQPRATRRQDR